MPTSGKAASRFAITADDGETIVWLRRSADLRRMREWSICRGGAASRRQRDERHGRLVLYAAGAFVLWRSHRSEPNVTSQTLRTCCFGSRGMRAQQWTAAAAKLPQGSGAAVWRAHRLSPNLWSTSARTFGGAMPATMSWSPHSLYRHALSHACAERRVVSPQA